MIAQPPDPSGTGVRTTPRLRTDAGAWCIDRRHSSVRTLGEDGLDIPHRWLHDVSGTLAFGQRARTMSLVGSVLRSPEPCSRLPFRFVSTAAAEGPGPWLFLNGELVAEGRRRSLLLAVARFGPVPGRGGDDLIFVTAVGRLDGEVLGLQLIAGRVA
jgi:hypothetical protein